MLLGAGADQGPQPLASHVRLRSKTVWESSTTLELEPSLASASAALQAAPEQLCGSNQSSGSTVSSQTPAVQVCDAEQATGADQSKHPDACISQVFRADSPSQTVLPWVQASVQLGSENPTPGLGSASWKSLKLS